MRIKELLETTPPALGLSSDGWTVRLMQTVLEREGNPLSLGCVHELMRKVGATFYRAENRSRRWRDAAEAHRLVKAVLRRAGWFADETSVVSSPTMSGAWSPPRGSQVVITQNGAEDRIHVLGALQPGRHFLWAVLPQAATGAVWSAWVHDNLTAPVLVDRAPIHTCAAASERLSNFELLFTPAYCSWVNPMEHVWAELQRRMRAKRYVDRLRMVSALRDSLEEIMLDKVFLQNLRDAYMEKYFGEGLRLLP